MPKNYNHSPWLEQLHGDRPDNRLKADKYTDIAVVGAGIAGISTAYFLLKHTWKRVTLIEADKVAHGATGHNAGQLVSYFERSFTDIAEEFGLDMAADGHRAVQSSWERLEDIYRDLKLTTPYQTFTGYAGCRDLEELLVHLQDNEQQLAAGLEAVEAIFITKSFACQAKIPRKLRQLYSIIPDQTVRDMLQTNSQEFVGVLASKKGCLNSARFCEEVIEALLKRYPSRLTLAEHSPVSTVKLFKHSAELISGKHTVFAKRVVLCTNGFEHFRIENHAGANIDTKFHHLVRGAVGYMAAFTEEPVMPPTAVSYLPAHGQGKYGSFDSEPYFYISRRPYGDLGDKSLVCIAGPDAPMDDTTAYSKTHAYPKEAKAQLTNFAQKTYKHTGRRLKYSHLWHGLMGYTPNGLRCVGAEPCNPVLMYNLGCNGVGILPSLFGSYRIAQLVKKGHLKPSIFDPADLRCMLPEKNLVKDMVLSDRWFSRHLVWGFTAFWSIITLSLLAAYWAKAQAPSGVETIIGL